MSDTYGLDLLRRSPEKVVRAATLTTVALLVFVVLALLTPRQFWWQNPAFVIATVLGVSLHSLWGETRPDLLDSEGAQRAYRLSLLVPVLILLLPLVFPRYGSWTLLWGLFILDLVLLAFSFVPRARCMALTVTTVVALGATVLDGAAAWVLGPVGLAWLVVPALDRLSRVRFQLPLPSQPSLVPVLRVAAIVFVVGVGVFLIATAVMPESTRDYVTIDPLAPGEAYESSDAGAVELPIIELLIFFALIVGFLLYVGRYRTGGSGEHELELSSGMETTLGGTVQGETIEEAAQRWPASPRRQLVVSYLRHLQRLDALGHGRTRGVTPRHHAAGLGHLPSADSATWLADAFGRARWSVGGVTAQDAQDAREAQSRIENELRGE